MSKVKQALLVVKIIIAIVACVLGYMFYQNYSASQKKIEDLKACDKLYNQDKWEEAVTAYKDYIAKYPDKRSFVSSKLSASLQNKANEKSIQAMAVPKKQTAKKQGIYREVIQLIETAKEYDDLTEMSYMVLCDSYVECNDYTNAKKVIAEAETKSNIKPARFIVQKRRIEQAEKKK